MLKRCVYTRADPKEHFVTQVAMGQGQQLGWQREKNRCPDLPLCQPLQPAICRPAADKYNWCWSLSQLQFTTHPTLLFIYSKCGQKQTSTSKAEACHASVCGPPPKVLCPMGRQSHGRPQERAVPHRETHRTRSDKLSSPNCGCQGAKHALACCTNCAVLLKHCRHHPIAQLHSAA